MADENHLRNTIQNTSERIPRRELFPEGDPSGQQAASVALLAPMGAPPPSVARMQIELDVGVSPNWRWLLVPPVLVLLGGALRLIGWGG